MFKLLPFAKKYRKEIFLGPFFKFLEAVFELLLPLLLARMIDLGLNKNNPATAWRYGLWMLALSILGLISAIICQYFASIASQGFGTELRSALMKKINGFSYQQLDHFGTKTLVNRLTNDITQVQTALAMFIRLFVRAPFLSIGSVVLAFYLDRQLGLIFLAVLPIFAIVLGLIIYFSVPLYSKVQKNLDNFNEQLSQNLTGVRVIRSFTKTDLATGLVKKISKSLAISYEKVANLSALLTPITSFLLNLGIIALLFFGSQQVNVGHLTQGTILALINYMSQMLLALIVVANLVVLFTRAQASGLRVAEVLADKDTLTVGHEIVDVLADDKNILTFQNVDFRYTTESGLVLTDISFSLKKGGTLGVIGGTGSGKSSLIPLIFHEYEASRGEIYFAEKNILTLEKAQLIEQLAVVFQQAVLFSGTIAENLAFGSTANILAMTKALQSAQTLDFVTSLPQTFDTPVEAGGQNFSGGQKQRLTLARALMKHPALLILDDATSALDYQTERQVQQALALNYPETAQIIISQRISSLIHADQILVLDNGHQAGLGTHDSLLETCSVYQAIYASQQEDAQ
ncbi:ABC transporter ATP-binding protein [Enterococcus timonensis]|uniref:ABC transporter ATP-binding protein n=1 Tax=Enterococcus timonensis TaxID=1852364 RepID=UPI0008DAAC95|nr:ABC transporter ATP-binding protein [Enterococcus timonensis]